MSGPLDGVRIIENSIAVAGPTCGMTLATLGAEVIRVESVKALTWGTREGKKSLALNLKSDKGKEIFKELIKVSDVFLTNFARGAMDRLGLGYEDLKKVNPKIIYANLTGYGHTGPDKDRHGFDFSALARSGITHVQKPYGWKQIPNTIPSEDALADRVTSLQMASAILAALHYRKKTGKGQMVDVAMFDSVVRNLMDFIINDYLQEGEVAPKDRLWPVGYGRYQCKDGFIILSILDISAWSRVLKVVGREDLVPEIKGLNKLSDSPDLAEKVDNILKEWVSGRMRNWLVKTFREANITADPVQSIPEATEDPQLRARNMFVKIKGPMGDRRTGGKVMKDQEAETVGSPVKMSETSGVIKRTGQFSDLGDHNVEILSSILGYSEEEVKKLEQEEVLR